MFMRRRPAPGYAKMYEAEHSILACNRPGRFSTYIVCPGVPYGLGEGDNYLHSLFKTAWECKEPCNIYGNGSNVMPMVHVSDLANYISHVAINLPPMPQQPSNR